jgi:hypothetical protein
VPQSIQEVLEQSRKLVEQSHALRETVKETTADAKRAVDHAKAIMESLTEQKKHNRKHV